MEIDPSNPVHLDFIRNPDTVEIKFVEAEPVKGKNKK